MDLTGTVSWLTHLRPGYSHPTAQHDHRTRLWPRMETEKVDLGFVRACQKRTDVATQASGISLSVFQ